MVETTKPTVRVQTVALGARDPLTWSELLTALRAKDGWSTWNEAFSVMTYVESVSQCKFKALSLGQATPPDDALEGRIFTPDAELRWVRDQVDPTFTAWATREWPLDSPHGEPVWRLDRPYLLLGERDEKKHGDTDFHDRRHPSRPFKYPVSGAGSRAFVCVAEYHRTQPEWSGLSAEAIEAALNTPLLVTHRFISLGTSDVVEGVAHG